MNDRKAQFIGSVLSAMVFVNICLAVSPSRRNLLSANRLFRQAGVVIACLLLVNVLLIIPANRRDRPDARGGGAFTEPDGH